MAVASQVPTIVNGNTSLTTIHFNNQIMEKLAQNHSSPEKQKYHQSQINHHQSYQQPELQNNQMNFPELTTQSQVAPDILHINNNNNINQRPPRTSEDFYLFCQFILEHENYSDMNHQEVSNRSYFPVLLNNVK